MWPIGKQSGQQKDVCGAVSYPVEGPAARGRFQQLDQYNGSKQSTKYTSALKALVTQQTKCLYVRSDRRNTSAQYEKHFESYNFL
jgi:hypothetical protein